MPIDKAMTVELADTWFPPFLDATRMSPTHPLREAAFKAAEQTVLDSYLDMADGNLPDVEFKADQDRLLNTASDVIEVLRGVAFWVALHYPKEL